MTAGHWLRDWQTFAAVARSMPDVQFTVVASADPGFEPMPNVEIHRRIDDSALAQLYKRADVLFLPLLQATANNSLLEGMASGLAIVATDLEATRAYLPDDAALFVENRSAGFVHAIRTLQQNRTFRYELGRRARARAEELSWARIIPQYEALYAKVAARF